MPRGPAPRICTLEIRADGKQYQSSIERSFLKPFEALPTAFGHGSGKQGTQKYALGTIRLFFRSKFGVNLSPTKPTMTENIRRLFKLMDHGTREEALVCLKHESGLQSRKSIRNEWIMGGRMPEAHQERTVEMFQNLLRKQQAKKAY